MISESEKLNEIIRLSSELVTVQDLDILLEKILFEARKITNADAGSIYVREGAELKITNVQNETQQAKLPEGKKLPYKAIKVKISKESISGYVASTGQIVNIPDVYKISSDSPFNFDSNYDKITGYKTTSMMSFPLKTSKNEILGVLQLINSRNEHMEVVPFNPTDEPFVLHFASIASMVIQKAQMTRIILLRMISMAEQRDPKETGAHVNRVASYSVELYERWAAKRNIDKDEIEKNRDVLRMAAMLHDVGKISISDLILKKPARFSEEEYEIMKSHTYMGAKLFKDKQSDFDEVASLVALTHHENWDGTGYPGNIDPETAMPIEANELGKPKQLKGEEIPIYGRLVALADVYDALSSKRVYKEAWDENDVLEEIKKDSGKKFDPELVDIFFEIYDTIKTIYHRYPE